MSEKSHRNAWLSMTTSMVIFGTIGIFRRYIPLSSALIAGLRGLLGAAALTIYNKITHQRMERIRGKKRLLLGIAGACVGLNWIFLFEAYNRTSVSIATLCYYMQPTIVMLLSPAVFHERLTAVKGIGVLLSLLGMVLVSGVFDGQKTLHGSDFSGIAFGITAALFYSCVVILNKKITVSNTCQKTTIELGSAALVLLPYLLLTERFDAVTIMPFTVLMILVVGLVHTALAYALYFAALPKLSAQSSALLSYIDPVSALIFSFLFLAERLTLSGLIGAVLIIGSAIVCEISSVRKGYS